MSHDQGQLPVKHETSVAEINTAAIETALDTLYGTSKQFAGTDPAILFATAELASDKPKKDRSPDEQTLVHFAKTVISVESAIKRGVITTPEDAALLADALIVYPSTNPSSVLRYLRKGGVGNLDRALSPTELVTCMAIAVDLTYDDTPVSVATVARIADRLGVPLDEVTQLNDEAQASIAAGLNLYDGAVEITAIEDDPIDGPVRIQYRRPISGSKPLITSDGAVNPAFRGELPRNFGELVADFGETSGVDLFGDDPYAGKN